MLVFTSREKDRNYHRSKNKLFNHQHLKTYKQKILFTQETNNLTINIHARSKSPPKLPKTPRSPSKTSKKSKNTVFSARDRIITQQIRHNAEDYIMAPDPNPRKREFRSPEDVYQQYKRQQRISQQNKRVKLVRSKECEKEEHIRRKQRYPKLFETAIETPKRTPPRNHRQEFIQQHGQINMVSNRESQELDELRQQNQFYRLIYKASLQKMKRLQRSIEKEKEEYERTKKRFDKDLKSLKYQINRNDKKVSIGHIYSYDQKETLKITTQNIIPQTDNEQSEITRNNDYDSKGNRYRAKDQLPSRLSIDSS